MSKVRLLVIQRDRVGCTTSPPSNFNLRSYAHKAHRVLSRHGLKATGVIVDSIDIAKYNLDQVNGFRLSSPRISPQLFKQIKKELGPLVCQEVRIEPVTGKTVDITF